MVVRLWPPSSDEAALGLLTVSGQLGHAGWRHPSHVRGGASICGGATLPARSTLV